MGSLMKALSRFSHPHYVVNFILSVSFFVLKICPPVCEYLFDDCHLELREWELITFLGCIIVMKNRKQSSYTGYLGTACMFAKMLNVILFARQNPIFAVVYVLACLLHLAFLPEPVYRGPECVTYFRGPHLENEIKNDTRVTWLIEFYTAWAPPCATFAPVFAELSAKYSLDNLKFGKIDVTRYPAVAEKFLIDTSSWSKQLPTLILFQGGKESRRRPACDSKGRVLAKFVFNSVNVVNDFELNELHMTCKQNLASMKRRGNKKDAAATTAEPDVEPDSSAVETEDVDLSGKTKTE